MIERFLPKPQSNHYSSLILKLEGLFLEDSPWLSIFWSDNSLHTGNKGTRFYSNIVNQMGPAARYIQDVEAVISFTGDADLLYCLWWRGHDTRFLYSVWLPKYLIPWQEKALPLIIFEVNSGGNGIKNISNWSQTDYLFLFNNFGDGIGKTSNCFVIYSRKKIRKWI